MTRGDKIAIVGKNGAGKTTLARMLVGELPPDRGSITWGHEAKIGYIPQDHGDSIRKDTNVTEWLHSHDSRAYLQDIRGLLGKMLFKGEEGLKPTAALSGGEAVRLLIARLMLTQDNVLVLDEPTNHLDLEAIVALGEGLAKYEGTCFVVTHDRDLIASFANRIFAFGDDGLVDYRGTYEEYLARRDADRRAASPRATREGKRR